MDERLVLKICRWVVGIMFPICLAFIISYTFFAQFLEQGFSMAPSINDRDIVLVNRLYKNFMPLNRNDVIVFYQKDLISIKRVYGLPGENVSIHDGVILINGEQISNESFEHSLSSNINQSVRLSADEYYVLGDNLDSSKDSRFSDIGNIKKKDIIGKVWYIIR